MIEFLRAWWQERWQLPPTEEPQATYPLVIVDWGDGSPLLDHAGGEAHSRDCGHLSRSYAYDPLREQSVCLACYRVSLEPKRR